MPLNDLHNPVLTDHTLSEKAILNSILVELNLLRVTIQKEISGRALKEEENKDKIKHCQELTDNLLEKFNILGGGNK